QQLIAWSMKYQPAVTHKKHNFALVPGKKIRQIDEKWVNLLFENPEIIGSKGVEGRNTAIFTLALAYYSSEIEQDVCFDDMDIFNSSLDYPLSNAEVWKIVKSAYRGKYRGATKKFVRILLGEWAKRVYSDDELFTQKRNAMYKFKKDRSERKRSHVHEWKADILEYLESECYRYRPEIELTKSELQAAVQYQDKPIPKRSLDKALNELKAEGKIYVQVRSGRGGGLVVATRKALIRTVIVVNQHVKKAYKNAIRTFFKEAAMLTKMIETPGTDKKLGLFGEQTNLWDTG
ncbi:primase C-terminal domain-containing protein, partial [Candidatus Enterococcus mansonii]